MLAWQEIRSYSPYHDTEMVRLSMTDGRGEFFTLIPSGEGKTYRERRKTALETLTLAIEQGADPGEVRTV